MNNVWNIAVTVCGLGGVGAFVFFSLYKQWLALPIFPKLTKKQAFILFLVFLVLTFLSLIALLVTYAVTDQRQDTAQQEIGEQRATINELRSSREELQDAINLVRRQATQLAFGVAETRGQALVVANDDATITKLAAKLAIILDQFKQGADYKELSANDQLQVRLSEATLANANHNYERSHELVTADDAHSEELATEAQIEREVNIQQVRGDAFFGEAQWDQALTLAFITCAPKMSMP